MTRFLVTRYQRLCEFVVVPTRLELSSFSRRLLLVTKMHSGKMEIDDVLTDEQKVYSEGFVQDVRKLLHDQAYHDVELKCSDGTVFANKLHLACRSEYFRALFDFENHVENNGKKSVDLNQFSSDVVQVVVDTLIHLDYAKIASVDSLNLLEIANYLQMVNLTNLATKKTAETLEARTVVDAYKIANACSNMELKESCENFISNYIFEVHEHKRLDEVDKKDFDRIVAKRMDKMNPLLENLVEFLKNFYKLMKDLNRIGEFKNFINGLRHHRGWIYFALTSDRSVLKLEPGHDINITEDMKIDPKSELGQALVPLCPKPKKKVDWNWKILKRQWTVKYGDL